MTGARQSSPLRPITGTPNPTSAQSPPPSPPKSHPLARNFACWLLAREVVSDVQAAKGARGSVRSAHAGLRKPEGQGRLEVDGRRMGAGGRGTRHPTGSANRRGPLRPACVRRLQPPGRERHREAGADPDDGPDRSGRTAVPGRLQEYPILLRTQSDPKQLIAAINSVVESIDPGLIASSSTLEELFHQSPVFFLRSLAAAIATQIGRASC